MAQVIQLSETGGPEVLTLMDVDLGAPGPGQVLLRQEAVGVNYLDVTQRRGAVPVPLPGGLGLEGAGVVAAVGPGVADVALGDRVAYALGPIGSYASERLYPAERLVRVPDRIGLNEAAAVLFKGLTAQYLIKSTYAVGLGTNVLLYGASGGVGQILAAWATHLGSKVIGVVSKSSSVERAKEAGCEHVLVWGVDDLPARVRDLTGGRGVDVVYDGIGRDTFGVSIDCLRVRGTMVSIGASSGLPEPVSIAMLNQKSLFMTRPGLAAYAGEVEEYRERARDVFDAVRDGIVRSKVGSSFSLGQAADAHRALEGGRSAGAVILRP